jgi:[acyl-carrier-protein] S-malonyltransferase
MIKKILISNVTANEVSNKEELKKLLVSQIENRVRWRESITNMISKGVNHISNTLSPSHSIFNLAY